MRNSDMDRAQDCIEYVMGLSYLNKNVENFDDLVEYFDTFRSKLDWQERQKYLNDKIIWNILDESSFIELTNEQQFKVFEVIEKIITEEITNLESLLDSEKKDLETIIHKRLNPVEIKKGLYQRYLKTLLLINSINYNNVVSLIGEDGVFINRTILENTWAIKELIFRIDYNSSQYNYDYPKVELIMRELASLSGYLPREEMVFLNPIKDAQSEVLADRILLGRFSEKLTWLQHHNEEYHIIREEFKLLRMREKVLALDDISKAVDKVKEEK